jgi:hypothetical protein
MPPVALIALRSISNRLFTGGRPPGITSQSGKERVEHLVIPPNSGRESFS